MDVSRELLFFFSALGAFNGLFLGLYFFIFAKPKHISNYFLGALLTALSIRIGKSVFFYFNPDLAYFYLQIGISACAFIGPSLYFYLKSMTTEKENIGSSWKYHYLLTGVIVIGVGLIYPWKNFPDLWFCYFIEAVYYQWLLYVLASAFLMRKVFRQFLSKNDKLNSVEIWILSVFIGNTIIWTAYYTVAYTSYIVGALSFSFIFYLLILLLFFNKKKNSILFKTRPKYADKKIKDEEANVLLQKLESMMIQQELFKNPNLKLSDVAQKLNILPHRLSQLMNDNLGKSFSSFINELRIEEAKKLIQSKSHFSLEAIGYECGFNSKSTFYSTFKKFTETTPAKFKEAKQ